MSEHCLREDDDRNLSLIYCSLSKMMDYKAHISFSSLHAISQDILSSLLFCDCITASLFTSAGCPGYHWTFSNEKSPCHPTSLGLSSEFHIMTSYLIILWTSFHWNKTDQTLFWIFSGSVYLHVVTVWNWSGKVYHHVNMVVAIWDTLVDDMGWVVRGSSWSPNRRWLAIWKSQTQLCHFKTRAQRCVMKVQHLSVSSMGISLGL